jgi:hypothetical protein
LPAAVGMRSRASGAGCLDASFGVSADALRQCGRSVPLCFFRTGQSETCHRLWTCCAGSRGSASLRAPESAHQQWGGSPHRTEHWLSVVEGNCVVERRGGRQPETNCQSINKTMLNTIRPDALASLRRVSEAQNRTPTREGQGNFGDLYQRRDSERRRRNAWGGW